MAGRVTLHGPPRMPQPDKRSALQVLTKARLRELVDAFELKLAAAESKDARSLVR